MLELRGVCAFYGASQALFSVSLTCARGQITTLLGRNGMGKTTTVATICGLMAARSGEILLDGQSLRNRAPFEIARCGIAVAPEDRRIFPTLTVRENLIAAHTRPNPTLSTNESLWTLDKVLTLFPPLAARLHSAGAKLSGGERQMLSIGRALMLNPRLLILDEATEGLAPQIRAEIWSLLATLKQTGLSMLLIDKHIDALAPLADAHYLIEKGRIIWRGDSAALHQDNIKSRRLGV